MITPGSRYSTARCTHAAVAEADLFRKLTCAFGLLARTGEPCRYHREYLRYLSSSSSVCQGCKTMALSAAAHLDLFWCDPCLYVFTEQLMGRTPGLILRAALVIVAARNVWRSSAVLTGGHFIVESWSVAAGSVLFGPLSSPISPVARRAHHPCRDRAVLLCRPGLSLATESRGRGKYTVGSRDHHHPCRVYAGPKLFLREPAALWHHRFIPIAALSALAAFFIGAGLIAAAGPATPPCLLFHGDVHPGHAAPEFCHADGRHHSL